MWGFFCFQTPVYLYYQGEFNEEVIRQQRFQPADLRMAVRKQGFVSFHQIDALILEGDGTISAVKKGDDTSPQSVSNVTWTKKSGEADE
ncbi:YetF domain-containing protein [Metaplanococcus flavidus]|uniref:YetF domain-containing protein n=1 Tax=Metaplanococcus flavidus TaxID=569883 RepID=A0ABW3LHL4_9BACL